MNIQKLLKLISEPAAYDLITKAGNRRVYVPKAITARFLDYMGGSQKDAQAMIDEYGGNFILPNLEKQFRYTFLRKQGYRPSAIGQIIGSSAIACGRYEKEMKAANAKLRHDHAIRDDINVAA